MSILALSVSVPISHAHENCAPYNVSHGYRDKIVYEETTPGEAFQGFRSCAGKFYESFVGFRYDSGRDVIHVGNAVFKTGCDEEGNGKKIPIIFPSKVSAP